MVTVNDRVVVLGGRDEDYNRLATVEELDTGDWTWSRMEQGMKEARYEFSAVAIPGF